MACTVDCLSQYGCNEINIPQEGAVYAPFVEMRFAVEGNQILTVGNSSSPPDNHAAIKSFEYGFQVANMGCGFKVEILDEGGITYRRLMRVLNKSVGLALQDAKNCTVRFGWVVKYCDGTTKIITNEDNGEKLYFLPSTMQTQFENGLVKVTFEGSSHSARWAETRLTDPLGSQDNKMPLKQALRQLFMDYDPKVENVRFKNKNGGELEFANSDGGKDGPKAAWPCDQQNAPAIARKWLSGIRTKDGLGILMFYDPTGPNVVFQESAVTTDCCEDSLGTYIVNGGNCSPVLSFNPQINWIHSLTPGGGGATPGAASGDSDKKIEPTIKIEKVGSQTGPTVQQSDWMWRMPGDMALKNADAIAAHLEANSPYEMVGAIEAELKIIGRPDLAYPNDLIDRTVAIIVINPFYISRQNCSWITTSNCNKVLSNKHWQIKGVSHQMSSGSYVTTMKVSLPTPNVTVPADDPLGGPGCGTETFDNSQATRLRGGS